METSASIEQPTAERVSESAANFWKLWTANSLSNLGDGLYQITLPLLAVQLTDSPTLIAGVSVAASLPWLIFALQAGSLVDQYDRRLVMISVTAARVLILLALTAALITETAAIPMVYAAALLLGMGETLVDTALTSIVPAIVAKDGLNRANARITAAQSVTNTFIGPPLAGWLAGIGFAFATGSSTLLYVLASIALTLMRGRFQAVAETTQQERLSFWKHVTEGLRFLWSHRLIRMLTLFTAGMNLFWSGWGAMLVLYVLNPDLMGLGEVEYGLILTAMAVGGLVGSALCERLRKWLGTRNALLLDMVGTVLLVGVPAISTHLIAVGAAAFAAGFGASVWVILIASIRQRVVPASLLGRVYSASRFVSWGIGPLGALLAGVVSELIGIRMMFSIWARLSIVLLGVFLWMVPPHLVASLDAEGNSSI